jgi:CubicO group peptidase (beta-lactamase class C family)
MHRNPRPVLGLILAFSSGIGVVLTGSAGEERAAKKATRERLADLLEPIRKKHDVPALAAAVVNYDGAIAVAAVGVRKRGDDTPVTADDKFHLGSDTKAMTATLVALFVEKSDLKWDDTLGLAFPDVAEKMTPEFRKITLTELLTHRAGLPANVPLGWFLAAAKGAPREQRETLLKQVVGDKLDSEPGEKFQYSNLGYILAAHMVEQVGRADWEDLITEKLFRPLGMKTPGFGAAGAPGKVDQPWGHRAGGAPVEPGLGADNPVVMGPAGRVHCSLPDWARFVALHLRAGHGDPVLLKPETLTLLHTPPSNESGYARGGWGVVDPDKRTGGPILTHDGSNTMNYCTASLSPDRHFAVLVACNQGGDPGRDACSEARAALLDEFLPGR